MCASRTHLDPMRVGRRFRRSYRSRWDADFLSSTGELDSGAISTPGQRPAKWGYGRWVAWRRDTGGGARAQGIASDDRACGSLRVPSPRQPRRPSISAPEDRAKRPHFCAAELPVLHSAQYAPDLELSNEPEIECRAPPVPPRQFPEICAQATADRTWPSLTDPPLDGHQPSVSLVFPPARAATPSRGCKNCTTPGARMFAPAIVAVVTTCSGKVLSATLAHCRGQPGFS